jgi:hypothetical protein
MTHSDKLFELFNALERSVPFQPESTAKCLCINWPPADESSRPFFVLYKTTFSEGPFAELINEATLQIADTEGDCNGLGLILKQDVELNQQQLEQKYKLVESDPAAPPGVPVYAILERSWGKIAFGLSDDGSERVTSVNFHVDEV